MKTYLVTIRTDRIVEVTVSGNESEITRAIEVFHEDHFAGIETEPHVVNVREVRPTGATA